MTDWKVIAAWLQARDHFSKMLIAVVADFLALLVAVLLAYALRISSFELPPPEKLPLYVIAPVLSVACAALAGIYRSVSRSYSLDMEQRILMSQLAVPPLWALILLGLGTQGFARSVVAIYFMVSLLLLVLLRRVAAKLFSGEVKSLPRKERIQVIIYGAGREGMTLAESLKRQGRYQPVAFVDTDYTLVGRTVAGLQVMASENMTEVMTRLHPQEVMIAKPKQNRASRRILVDMFMSHGLQVKTVPDLDDIVDGKIDANALRPIRLEDLLGRDPVPPDRALMEKVVKDRVILVTGAGGSIGSELVRQAASFAPKRIVMVDNNEFSLFEINRDLEGRLEARAGTLQLVPVLADILDAPRMAAIMAKYDVEVVLHAAAYKHVRMVQENAAAGIRNNVWGTMVVAEAAMAQGVKLFILVSTDKAVRPTSIMGASKRVAEMVVQGLTRKKGNGTVFAVVRFGNVLGSTGSVVPLFREQIAKGGPVFVTHPEVTRYFMLIPEAAQLVIQAGAMAECGEVFVLDMGESVKIVNLAETMIELAGMTQKTADNPDGDIEIKFTGLRDGEKLYEELQIGRDVSITPHPRIMRSNEFYLPMGKLWADLKHVETQHDDDGSSIERLMKLANMGS